MPKTFSDIEVIEICSGYGPATFAGKLLADMGFRVTKIEPSNGDELRWDPIDEGSDLSLFSLVCANKDSVCLDLEHPDVGRALEQMLSKAGILLLDAANWRSISATLGDASAISARYPALTVCVASHFGTAGPLARWSGSEETIQALSGVMSTTGQPGEPPTRIPGAMLTHGAGMFAVIAILGDLMAKRRSGKGAFLDCDAMLPAAAFLTAAYPAYFLSGEAPAGIGNRHAMSAPWNTFQCSDGWLVICAGNEPSWRRLCATIGRSDLLADPRFATAEARVTNVDALEPEIAAWTCSRTVAEAERVIDGSGTPCGAIVPLGDVLQHPQFKARGLLRGVGAGATAGSIFHRDGLPTVAPRARCDLGEGTSDVLSRLGIDPISIQSLIARSLGPKFGDVA